MTDQHRDRVTAARAAADAIEPDQVTTRAHTADQLAQHTVESLTEHDRDDLPVQLRVRLALWWVDYLTWDAGR